MNDLSMEPTQGVLPLHRPALDCGRQLPHAGGLEAGSVELFQQRPRSALLSLSVDYKSFPKRTTRRADESRLMKALSDAQVWNQNDG